MIDTPEQAARDILERMGIDGAQSFTAGNLVELANMIAELRRLQSENTELYRAIGELAARND